MDMQSLHEAAKSGDLEMVKALLKSNPDQVFGKQPGLYGPDDPTPLHVAAEAQRNVQLNSNSFQKGQHFI